MVLEVLLSLMVCFLFDEEKKGEKGSRILLSIFKVVVKPENICLD